MNLSKLAQMANVSVSTASKAFSTSHEVSEQTREMIFSIAKEHGCFDKYYKPVYDKKVIAVICPEMLGIHYSQMAAFLSNEISSRNGTTLISVHDFSPQKEQELIDYYTKFCNTDGIIVIEPPGVIKNNTDIPIVQIGIDNGAKNVDCVNVVANQAMDDALSYLVKNNYKRIGFIGEKYAVQEYDYFTSALKRLNIDVDENDILISDMRFYDAGYYGMGDFIKRNNLPDVVFAAYSHIAIGILQRLKEEKLSVPGDISVICMDDINIAPYSDVRLSSIKMHVEEVCDTALNLLYQKIEKNHIKVKRSVNVIREFSKGESLK
ncbi:MAG: LacI family DNA-binding transcriptional regulator [Clostridia bacterium]|nr:LacI family DNA-binding transcriptional regulator [Clostridia bacterium]